MVPSVLNDKPFYEDIVAQEKPKVKRQDKKSERDSALSISSNDLRALFFVKFSSHAARLLLFNFGYEKRTRLRPWGDLVVILR